MPGRLPAVTVRQLLRALAQDGWYVERTTRHQILRHLTKPGSIPVPNHPGATVKPGTLRSILRMAGLTNDEFRSLL